MNTEHHENHELEPRHDSVSAGTIIPWITLVVLVAGIGVGWGYVKGVFEGEFGLVKKEQKNLSDDVAEIKHDISDLDQKIDEVVLNSIRDNTNRIRETEENCTRLWRRMHQP
jgi:hypothetical protein